MAVQFEIQNIYVSLPTGAMDEAILHESLNLLSLCVHARYVIVFIT